MKKFSSLLQLVAAFLLVIVQISAGGSVVDETRTASSQDAKDDLHTCKNDDGECTPTNDDDNDNENNQSSNKTTTSSFSSSNFCLDDREQCAEAAALGECERNPAFMHAHCKLSCNACPVNLKYVDMGYGEPQESSGDNATAIDKLIQDTQVYMKTTVMKRAIYLTVRDDCINRDKLCSKWATEGECTNNKLWMTINCAPGK
jgi:hypothetical protein